MDDALLRAGEPRSVRRRPSLDTPTDPAGRVPRYRVGLGRLCLDFAATAASPTPGGGEQLRVPSDARSWLVAADLPAARLASSPGDLSRMVTLRDATAVVLVHALEEEAGIVEGLDVQPALEVVNEAAAIAPPRPRLHRSGSAGRFVVAWEQPSDLAPFLSAISRDLLALVADEPSRARLHRCAAPDCRRVFMAKPIGRSRRWCSSQGCGARARVANYRARHAGDALAPHPRDAS